VFASGSDVRDLVEADGFDLLCSGPDFGSLVAESLAQFPDTPLESPEDQQRFGFGRLFSDVRVGASLEDATARWRAYRPALVVNEVADFVGPLVAARLGIPNATLGVGLVLADEWLQLAAEGVAKYWAGAGLEPRADAGVYRALYLNQWPRSLQRRMPEQCEVRDLRPEVFGEGSPMPADLDHLGRDRPLIYVTFGTMFGDAVMLRTVVEGLVELDADIVATVGHGVDPTAVDLQRSNLAVRDFVPQGALLGRWRLVVNHGGSGSVLGPLHYGVPLVLVPRGADQLENARQLASAGVARVIQPTELTPSHVAETARAALDNDELLRTAIATQREIASMAAATDIVSALEDLAR
jgi:UDP-N-acetylglucosamine transferase subunit ALG13